MQPSTARKRLFIVMLVKPVDGIFEPVAPHIPKLRVEKRDGDPVGFCPVFSSEESARAAYPDASIMEVLGPPGGDD